MTKTINSVKTESSTVHRIAIAWAISECAIGGLMHAVRSPFTGLIVGGLSVLFISLIAFHAQKPAMEIIKSLVFVLSVKIAISPHAPIGAFVAVSVQALLGAVFFTILPHFKTAALCSSIFSLLLSAAQKIITLTIFFGRIMWVAIDEFVAATLEKFGLANIEFSSSMVLIGLYFTIYLIGGILIGIMAGRVPYNLQRRATELDIKISHFSFNHLIKSQSKKRRFLFPLLMIFLLISAFQFLVLPPDTAISQFVRTVLIIIVWLLLCRPLLGWLLRKILGNTTPSITYDLQQVQEKIPRLIQFGRFAWKSKQGNLISSSANFLILVLFYAIYRL